jgi:hypothetical protein
LLRPFCAADAKTGKPLPRRQELEIESPEAFLSVEELQAVTVNTHPMRLGAEGKLPIVVVSYTWEEEGHPDPRGEQLAALAAAIEAEQSREDPKQRLPNEVGVFMDWVSLCQKLWGSHETAAFTGALQQMQLWYAHKLTTVFLLRNRTAFTAALPEGERPPSYEAQRVAHVVLTSREARYTRALIGTCFFRDAPQSCAGVRLPLEVARHIARIAAATSIAAATFERACSSMVKTSVPWCWAPVVDVGHPETRRLPPLTPDKFEAVLDKCHFTNGKEDFDLVGWLYRKTVLGYFGHTTEIRVIGAGWGDEEVTTFAEVLPICNNVKSISLNSNSIGDKGIAALASIFKVKGVLPNLQVCSPPAPASTQQRVAAVPPCAPTHMRACSMCSACSSVATRLAKQELPISKRL